MPHRPSFALAFVAILAACGPEAPPSGKDDGPEATPSGKGMVVVAGTGEEKAVDAQGQAQPAAHVQNDADFDKHAFTCCASPSAGAVVSAYVDLAERLAADDEAGAQAAVVALSGAATAAAADAALSEAVRTAAGAVATGTAAMQGKPIAELRSPLASLGVTVVGLAREQQGGEQRLVAAFCPMAPGHWLQRDAPIRNPYYGADMLACGTLEPVAEVR